MEIKGDDQLSGAQQWMTKSLTEEKTMKSFSKVSGKDLLGDKLGRPPSPVPYCYCHSTFSKHLLSRILEFAPSLTDTAPAFQHFVALCSPSGSCILFAEMNGRTVSHSGRSLIC